MKSILLIIFFTFTSLSSTGKYCEEFDILHNYYSELELYFFEYDGKREIEGLNSIIFFEALCGIEFKFETQFVIFFTDKEADFEFVKNWIEIHKDSLCTEFYRNKIDSIHKAIEIEDKKLHRKVE